MKRPCSTDSDFQRAINFQRDVEVWIEGELDTVGTIEKLTRDSVKIKGSHYFRDTCKFYMV